MRPATRTRRWRASPRVWRRSRSLPYGPRSTTWDRRSCSAWADPGRSGRYGADGAGGRSVGTHRRCALDRSCRPTGALPARSPVLSEWGSDHDAEPGRPRRRPLPARAGAPRGLGHRHLRRRPRGRTGPHLRGPAARPRLADRAPRIVETRAGHQVWEFEGGRYSQVGMNAVAGRRPETVRLEPFRFEQMRPGCFDVDARVADMDVNGVWASLNFPSQISGFCGRVFFAAEDPALGRGLRAGVERLALRGVGVASTRTGSSRSGSPSCPTRPRRPTRSVATPPGGSRRWRCPNAPTRSVCRACGTGTTGTRSSRPAWRRRPSSASMSAVRGCRRALPGRPPCRSGRPSSGSCRSRRAPSGCGRAIRCAIPDLAIAMSEGGIGWVAMLLDRLDNIVDRSGYGLGWDVRPADVLQSATSGSARSTTRRPSTPATGSGSGNIMVETDYPHGDGTWPDTQAVLRSCWGHLPDDEVRAICSGNAAALVPPPAARRACCPSLRMELFTPAPGPTDARAHAPPGTGPAGPGPVARGVRRPPGRPHHRQPRRRHAALQPVAAHLGGGPARSTCCASRSTATSSRASGRFPSASRSTSNCTVDGPTSAGPPTATRGSARSGPTWPRCPRSSTSPRPSGAVELVLVDEYSGPVNDASVGRTGRSRRWVTPSMALLAGHGVFVLGGSARAVHQRAVALEQRCRNAWLVRAAGGHGHDRAAGRLPRAHGGQ